MKAIWNNLMDTQDFLDSFVGMDVIVYFDISQRYVRIPDFHYSFKENHLFFHCGSVMSGVIVGLSGEAGFGLVVPQEKYWVDSFSESWCVVIRYKRGEK